MVFKRRVLFPKIPQKLFFHLFSRILNINRTLHNFDSYKSESFDVKLCENKQERKKKIKNKSVKFKSVIPTELEYITIFKDQCKYRFN